MGTGKHFISINMLENRINMAKDQISVWEYQGKEILPNMELKFFEQKSALDLYFHIKQA